MHADLTHVVQQFSRRRILLVGDFMLDRYIFGDADRISPEAPVPVLRIVERQDRVGGAGSVALNILALGGAAICCGALGRDTFGDRVLAMLTQAGADPSGLMRLSDRPTITKTRIIGLAEHRHRQQMIRVDDEVVAPLPPHDYALVERCIRGHLAQVDVVCLEDYGKGVLSAELCGSVIAAARQLGKPVLVDPARGGGWEKYRGATLLTPNRAELEIGYGKSLRDEQIDEAACAVVKRLQLDALVVTLGREGARLVRSDDSVQRFPTQPRAVYDNTGAGDAVLAMMAVAVAAGATLEQAVPLANIAGGLEVSKFGCVAITRDEVLEELRRGAEAGRGKIRAAAELASELTARRNRGETVVFTNGCFDILHPGHVELLERSKALGSLLVVGLNSDASVRSLNKGEDRPIRRQQDRARMLSALESVDYVVVFDEPDPGSLIEQIAPDVLVKGSDWSNKGVVGADFVRSRGGRVELISLVDGYSTTGELRRIRGEI